LLSPLSRPLPPLSRSALPPSPLRFLITDPPLSLLLPLNKEQARNLDLFSTFEKKTPAPLLNKMGLKPLLYASSSYLFPSPPVLLKKGMAAFHMDLHFEKVPSHLPVSIS